MKNLMNKYVNPPCNNSLATSFIISTKIMSSSGREGEVGRSSPFGDVVEEGVLEIDEREVGESVSPVPPFTPDLSVVEREGVECVRRVLERLSSEAMASADCAVERDDNDDANDSFVDVVGDEETDEGAVSEGFTFAEALMRVNLVSETVLEGGVGSSEMPLC